MHLWFAEGMFKSLDAREFASSTRLSCTRTDTSNAFLPDGPQIAGAAQGPLCGLTFAAKDLYDVSYSVYSK